MGLEETIHERIEMGFFSDSPTGKAQIRAAKVRLFFSDYANFSGDDGSELQQRAFDLGITAAEWESNRNAFTVQF